MKKIAATFLIALMGGVFSLGLYKITLDDNTQGNPQQEIVTKTKLVGLESMPDMSVNYVNAAEMTVNTVVHVKTEGTREYSEYGFDPLRQFFYGDGRFEQKRSQPVRGAGSGVIISNDGYIVTNNHVVEDAQKVKVTLNNNKTYEANIVGLDPTTDLAVLKIKEGNLPFVNYGNSDEVRVGEWVLAVGNPFNLTSTVTAGIISAKGRDINILGNDPFTGMSSIESFIQTDAAVNPGNSGGALVNTSGELIGINTAIKSNTGSFAGYSFAIPVNIVSKVVDDLIEYGAVQRAFIGINIRNIDEQLAEEEDINDLNGVYVAGLAEKGAAADAGIKKGDIVKSVNGISVKTVSELQEKVGQYRPGDEITVGLLRNEQLIERKVTLKNLDGKTSVVKNDKMETFKKLGARLSEIDRDQKKELKIEAGVQVDQLLPGRLRNTGMKEGFIITKVDNRDVSNVDELVKILEDRKGGILIEGIYPNGQTAYYGFGL